MAADTLFREISGRAAATCLRMSKWHACTSGVLSHTHTSGRLDHSPTRTLWSSGPFTHPQSCVSTTRGMRDDSNVSPRVGSAGVSAESPEQR